MGRKRNFVTSVTTMSFEPARVALNFPSGVPVPIGYSDSHEPVHPPGEDRAKGTDRARSNV